MSLSDVLYPGNPDRREMVIRKNQELIELMKSNFEATNDLIEVVNKHLGSSFSPITLNEKATVKENCEVFIERMNQIQAKVEEVDEKLKKMLDPAVYEKLHQIPLKSFKNMPAGVKIAIGAGCQISTAIIVICLKNSIPILRNITSVLGKFVIGGGVSFLIGFAIDLIISAIVGAVEREKLETALAEYDKTLAEFRPASKEYEKAIWRVMFILEDC